MLSGLEKQAAYIHMANYGLRSLSSSTCVLPVLVCSSSQLSEMAFLLTRKGFIQRPWQKNLTTKMYSTFCLRVLGLADSCLGVSELMWTVVSLCIKRALAASVFMYRQLWKTLGREGGKNLFFYGFK